jgi:Glycosyltransferase family 87
MAVALAAWHRHRFLRQLSDVAVAALVLFAAARAARLYYDELNLSFAAGVPSYDLGTFLRAASDVVGGASPYSFRGDATYAYPPFLAVLAVPLHWLSPGLATLVWMGLSLAAIALALRLLGVRDWRCYALAADYPFVKPAILAGTATPLLLLAVAICWRWRQHVLKAAVVLGAAVALKLFLWPLFGWLAITRGIRTTIAAIGVAAGFALLPWAAIGFAGIGTYPGLLRRLSDDEAKQSFSILAIGARANLGENAARALSVVIALVLLAAAYRMARDHQRSRRDRDAAALVLSLAAALAATPIVWLHYFLLLLVPLALRSPRLSPFWLFPFAYVPIEHSAWAYGDAGKLAIALAASSALIAAAVMRTARDVHLSNLGALFHAKSARGHNTPQSH